MAQVVKVLAPGSVLSTVFEHGFDSCMWLIFFQDEGGEIANCKTYVKNVIVASAGDCTYSRKKISSIGQFLQVLRPL